MERADARNHFMKYLEKDDKSDLLRYVHLKGTLNISSAFAIFYLMIFISGFGQLLKV